MGVVEMCVSVSLGMEAWLPMKLISAVWWGVDALIGGSGVVAIGVRPISSYPGSSAPSLPSLRRERYRNSSEFVYGILYADGDLGHHDGPHSPLARSRDVGSRGPDPRMVVRLSSHLRGDSFHHPSPADALARRPEERKLKLAA